MSSGDDRMRIGYRSVNMARVWAILLLMLQAGDGYYPPSPGAGPLDFRHFDSIISTYMKERRVPGANIAISKDGHVLLKKGYGRAGKSNIVTPWSLFRIGSVTKMVTAAGVLRLVEEGKLMLNQTVFGVGGILSEYRPGSDLRLLSVTVAQLLQHTAGWDQEVDGDILIARGVATTLGEPEPPDQDALIRYMMRRPLVYTPGTRYSYNNFGYMVLGRVISRVSGQPYGVYMKSVLWRAGIYRMKLGHTRRDEAQLSEVKYFSTYPASRIESVFPKDGMVSPCYGGFYLENMDASAGWIGSASDLLDFLGALRGEMTSNDTKAILRPETFQTMLAPPQIADRQMLGHRTWYGMGVVVEDHGASWWHSGGMEGSSSVLSHHESGYNWAVLLNSRLMNNDLNDLMRYALHRNTQVPQGKWTKLGRRFSPSTPVEWVADAVTEDGGSMVKLLIPERKFTQLVELFSAKDYRMTFIGAVTDQYHHVVFYNTVWTKNRYGLRWKAYISMSPSRYKRRFRSMMHEQFRLLHVDVYATRHGLRYAAVFVKDSWPAWLTYHGLSPVRHKAEFFQYVQQGYRLVVQSVAEYRGRLYVAAIYDKIYLGEFRVRLGLNQTEYVTELQRQTEAGRVLSYVQMYEYKGRLRYSAIFDPMTSGRWATAHALTKYSLLNKVQEYSQVNVALSCVTGFHDGEGFLFTALWR